MFLTTIFGELVDFGVQLVIAAFGLSLGQFKLLSKSVNFELRKNKFVCHEDVLRVDVPYSSSRWNEGREAEPPVFDVLAALL